MKKVRVKRTGATLRVALLVGVLAFTMLISDRSYTKENIQFYDTIGSEVDYRGVRSFSKPLKSTRRHMHNGWDYYIAYLKNGKISRYQFLKNGNIVYETRHVYKNGKLVKLKSYKSNTLVMVTFLNGDPLKIKTTYPRGKMYMIQYFTSAKKLEKAEQYSFKRKLLTYTKIKYNKSGLRSRFYYYDGDDNLLAYKKILYRGGRKVKTLDYTAKKKLRGYTTYFYDQTSKLISAKRFSAKGKLMGSTEYEYDDRGFLRYTLYYDGQGRLVVR